MWRQQFWALLAAVAGDSVLPPGYSVDEPSFDHENIAIRLDAAGRAEESHQSFVASARFADGVTALDNLGVSHMRRGEWVEAAQSYARALSRHSKTRNLEDNVEVFKQYLSQPRVPRDTRERCLRILRDATEASRRWPSPASIYSGARVARDEQSAPLYRKIANRTSFWKFLRSDAFVGSYWERRPLHMTVGEEGEADNGFANVLPLRELLAEKYVFAMEKGKHRDRNVHLVKGSFRNPVNTMGFKVRDTPHPARA